MATPDVTATPDFRAAQGGSSSIQVLLSATQAEEAYKVDSSSPLAAEGWHEISPALTGGSIGRERDVTEVRLENDVEWTEIVSNDNIVITNTTIVVDPLRFNLLEWMEDHYFKVRYNLPTRNDGGYETKVIDTAAPTSAPVAHWWMFPRVSARKENWTMDIENDSLREVQFVLEASRPTDSSDQDIYFQEILPLDGTTSVATPADRGLRADWSEAPYSDYNNSATP